MLCGVYAIFLTCASDYRLSSGMPKKKFSFCFTQRFLQVNRINRGKFDREYARRCFPFGQILGKSFQGIITSEVQNVTACSITFSSSRIFPGQLYDNKQIKRFLGYGINTDPLMCSILLNKIRYQQRYILFSLPQRRELNGNHMEPIIEVLTKTAFLYQFLRSFWLRR